MFPLLIGASVGPEAGLTGVIVGLCCWVGDKLKRYYNEAHDLAAIGASASLATIFRSPMFGFVEPLEGEADAKLPKAPKTVLYILAILSSFGIFILLNRLTGGGTGFPSVQCGSVAPLQYGWAIVLTIVGVAMLGPVKNVVVRCVIGGLALGGIGTLLPLTMFSGEHEIETILEQGTSLGIITLLLIAVAKLFLTSMCIASGLKGGHFFPVIFAGIAAGSAFSLILGIDAGFCMAVITAALLGLFRCHEAYAVRMHRRKYRRFGIVLRLLRCRILRYGIIQTRFPGDRKLKSLLRRCCLFFLRC